MDESHVTLKIVGYPSLAELSEKLALTPTATRRKGQLRPCGPRAKPRFYRAQKKSYWEYRWTTESDGDFFIGDFADTFVVTVIEPRKAVLKEILSLASGELSVVQYYRGCNPGMHLNVQSVAVLGEIGLEIDVDLYCFPEDE